MAREAFGSRDVTIPSHPHHTPFVPTHPTLTAPLTSMHSHAGRRDVHWA